MIYIVQHKNGTQMQVNASSPEDAVELVLNEINDKRKQDGRPSGTAKDFGLFASEEPGKGRSVSKEEAEANANEAITSAGLGALGLAFPMTREAVESGEPTWKQAATAGLEGAMMGIGPLASKVVSGAKYLPQFAKGIIGTGAVEGAANVAALKGEEALSGQELPVGVDVAVGTLPIAGGAASKGIDWLTGAMKRKAPDILENVFTPKKKNTANPNPVNFQRMLEENMFSGVGKFSALDKLNTKINEITEPLNDLIKTGNPVDIEQARRFAIKRVDDMGGDAKDVADLKAALNERFDYEADRWKKRVPAEYHLEDIENPKYTKRAVEIETKRRAEKSDYTRAMTAWKKTKHNRGEKPPEPPETMRDGWSAKSENELPQFISKKIIDKAPYYSNEWPVSDALKIKSKAQEAAFKQENKAVRGMSATYREKSRGMLDAIAESNPEVREQIANLAPYYSAQNVIQEAQNVGGKKGVLGLRDWLAIGAGAGMSGASDSETPLLGAAGLLGVSKLLTTPKGAQIIYNTGKTMAKAKTALKSEKPVVILPKSWVGSVAKQGLPKEISDEN